MGFQMCGVWTAERIFILSLAIIAAFCIDVIIMVGIKNTFNLSQFGGKLKALYLISCFLFFVGSTFYMLFEIFVYSPYYCIHGELVFNVLVIGYAGYLLGLVALYTFLVFRLKLSFKGTYLELSDKMYYFLLFGVFVELLPICTGVYAAYISIDDVRGHEYTLMSTLFFSFANAFFGILLFCIFIKKTYHLVGRTSGCATKDATRTSSVHDDNAGADSDVDSIDSVNSVNSMSDLVQTTEEELIFLHSLLDPSVKYLICASFAVISTILANYMAIHRNFVVENDTFELLMWHVSAGNTDILVNAICLHLQFVFCKNQYDMFCKPCKLAVSSLMFKKWMNSKPTVKSETSISQTQMYNI